MPPDQPAVQPQGTPPPQTPTGEIKDQSLLNQTPPAGDPPAEPQSLLNQDAPPPVEAKSPEPKPGDKPPAGVPEKYELKLPDGFAISDDATALFKDLKLDNASAQKLADFHIAKQEAAGKAPYDLWQQTQEDWVKEIKADPEIGGKLDEVRRTTAKAIDQHLPPELAKSFRAALNFTGAGNNPTFVKAFYQFSKLLTEGTHVPAGGPVVNPKPGSDSRPNPAAAIYPNLNPG